MRGARPKSPCVRRGARPRITSTPGDQSADSPPRGIGSQTAGKFIQAGFKADPPRLHRACMTNVQRCRVTKPAHSRRRPGIANRRPQGIAFHCKGPGVGNDAAFRGKGIEFELLTTRNTAGRNTLPADETGIRTQRDTGSLRKARTGERNDRVGQMLQHAAFFNPDGCGKPSLRTADPPAIDSRGSYRGYLHAGCRAGLDGEFERVARENPSRHIVKVNQGLALGIMESAKWRAKADPASKRSCA